MAISVGDTLPQANLLRIGANGPETVALADLVNDRRVVIFAVPGAFTPTCSNEHMPSFVQHAEAFTAKGIDAIICVSVNDPYVMDVWGDSTGASKAGVTLLADSRAEFTKTIGMEFSDPTAGLFDRSARYSMYVENGVVKAIKVEDAPSVCNISSGGAILEQI